MILPEKEALEKLCVDINTTKEEYFCYGSDCMAWKWVKDYEGHGCCGKVYPDVFSFPNLKGE